MSTSPSPRRSKPFTANPASLPATTKAARCASCAPRCTDACSATATAHDRRDGLPLRVHLRILQLLRHHHRIPAYPATAARRCRPQGPNRPPEDLRRHPQPPRHHRLVTAPLDTITHISSTIAASTNTAAMSRRSNSRLPITLNSGHQPPPEISDQKVSGLTGMLQKEWSCLQARMSRQPRRRMRRSPRATSKRR